MKEKQKKFQQDMEFKRRQCVSLGSRAAQGAVTANKGG